MAERIDPWGSIEIEDYGRLMTDFGIESIEPYKKNLRTSSTYVGA
ncbi:MAG: hypothetical protein V1703_01850 [Candidatus Altiarchaeota archaeon]